MNCKDYQELVSAAVDNLLGKEEMDSFVEHIGTCRVCRQEYESDAISRSLVRTRLKMLRTPGELVARIGNRLREADMPLPGTAPRFKLLTIPFLKPTVAVGAACLALIIVIALSELGSRQTLPVPVAASDVIQQSFDNYRAVVNGEIRPQILSSQPEVLKGLLSGKTDFQVIVPSMKDCNLVGALLNEHKGSNLVHVVYTHAAEVLYLYQTCWETVIKGEKLTLPAEAMEGLQRTGWFVESRPDGCTIVLWTKGQTLCAAVSRMREGDLIACLGAGTAPAPW